MTLTSAILAASESIRWELFYWLTFLQWPWPLLSCHNKIRKIRNSKVSCKIIVVPGGGDEERGGQDPSHPLQHQPEHIHGQEEYHFFFFSFLTAISYIIYIVLQCDLPPLRPHCGGGPAGRDSNPGTSGLYRQGHWLLDHHISLLDYQLFTLNKLYFLSIQLILK